MFGIIAVLLFSLLAAGVAYWVMTLVRIITSESKTDTDKLIWFLFVFFMPFIGTIVYHFVGRDKVSMEEPVGVMEEDFV